MIGIDGNAKASRYFDVEMTWQGITQLNAKEILQGGLYYRSS